MNKQPYTWDGTSIQDSNFESWVVEGRQTILSNGTPIWTQQAGAYPKLSGVNLAGGMLTIAVACKGTLQSQQETLKAMFDIDAPSAKRLVIQDTADSNRQWYVMARPLDFQRDETSATFIVSLALQSPVWLTVASTTESTWSVVATGGTVVVNKNIGNLAAYPVLDITPVLTRNAGAKYRRFATTYNRTQLGVGGYPIDITNGGWNTTAMVSDSSVSNQINKIGGISAVDATIDIDAAVGGGLPSVGMGYVGTEQISWTGKSGGQLTGCSRGVGGTTAATHADDAVITLSHILADGSDIRVKVGTTAGNASENPYWLSTTTLSSATALKIWTNINYPARTSGALTTGISNAVAAFQLNSASGFNRSFPTSGGTVLIGTERITYTAYNSNTRMFTGCTRGALDSSAASHSAGDVVILIPIIYIYYGNQTLTAPTYSVAKKPVFDLASSTNTSWVYAYFTQSGQAGLDRWTPSKTAGVVSTYNYTSNHGITGTGVQTDPAEEIGCSLVQRNNLAAWDAYFPFGFSAIALPNVERYNLTAGYGYIQSSYATDAPKKTLISATTLANTWQAESITHTPTTPHRSLRFALTNPSSSNLGKRSAIEADAATATLSNATTSSKYGVPSIAFGAEVSVDYELDATITNNTTGEAIYLNADVPFNQTLRVDTLNKTVKALWDNTNKYADFQTSTDRETWLYLQSGNNTLQYDETGVVSVNIVVTWQGRNN